jgi:hypothetical protein
MRNKFLKSTNSIRSESILFKAAADKICLIYYFSFKEIILEFIIIQNPIIKTCIFSKIENIRTAMDAFTSNQPLSVILTANRFFSS